MEHSGYSIEQLLDITGKLYEGAVRPDAWWDFLSQLTEYFGAHGGHFGSTDPAYRELNFSMLYGFDEYIRSRYLEHENESLSVGFERFEGHFAELMTTDPRVAACAKYPNRPFHCRQLASSEELHSSSSYKEILAPSKIEYSLMLMIPGESGEFIFLGVFRGPADKPFGDEDLEQFGLVATHLRRTASLRRNILSLQLDRVALQDAMDALPIGVLVVDRSSQVISCNKRGSRIIDLDVVRAGDVTRLVPKSPLGRSLYNSIADVLVTGDDVERARLAYSMPKPGATTEYQILVSRVGEESGGVDLSANSQPLALVIITDAAADREMPRELLQRLFGLTRAESEVLSGLVSGKNLREIARSNGLSYNTARVHLQAIFQKTGQSRQADLVRHVLSSPLWAARSA